MSTESRELPVFAPIVDAERLAQLIAHRVCHAAEHDPLNGRIHGYCIVCGVPFPCTYAGQPPGNRHPLDLAHSRAQDSGGEAAWCHIRPHVEEWHRVCEQAPHAEYVRMTGSLAEGLAAFVQDVMAAAEQPAKGDVPLCEKYGDGCNFPDCPCDVDDPLTQQPFKGECFADALDEDIKEARTPQPSDAQQASRASNPADAVCDCGSNVDNRQPHHDECAIYATPPTAQRHDEGTVWKREILWTDGEKSVKWIAGDKPQPYMETVPHPDITARIFVSETLTRYVPAAHGTNCQSAKADGGAVAPAAVEAVAWERWHPKHGAVDIYRGEPHGDPLNLGWIDRPLIYAGPHQQRSEQVAVSAAVVARALVECPISLVAESRWEWIAKYINTALSKQVAGGGGVDAEKVLSAYVRICIQEHDERSTSEDRVDAMRRALSTAALSTQPLLSDQPAGSEAEETDNG